MKRMLVVVLVLILVFSSVIESEAIGSSRRSARRSRRRSKRDSGIHHPSDLAIASNKDTEQEDLKHGDNDPNEAQASQPSSS